MAQSTWQLQLCASLHDSFLGWCWPLSWSVQHKSNRAVAIEAWKDVRAAAGQEAFNRAAAAVA